MNIRLAHDKGAGMFEQTYELRILAWSEVLQRRRAASCWVIYRVDAVLHRNRESMQRPKISSRSTLHVGSTGRLHYFLRLKRDEGIQATEFPALL